MKNKLTATARAFSVLEAAFSMVITAIVIGLVFIVFSILSERMLDFKNQNQFVADMNRLTYALNKDIFDSEKMSRDDENIVFNTYAGANVKYLRVDEYTIRSKDGFQDTFRIPLTHFIIDTVKNKNNRIVFQRLSLELNVNQQLMNLKFFKKVYSNELMKNYK
ncbi:hypothetical protein [Flavobacterium phycosphaerae]|uniref:hypothetical protein n=1 Tax=Flavobacterium phycosphaerae TaxID=2697515 RepID=UPI0013897C09|nr:hypothetical protein [Flavobacterium phycosphaerae]